VAVNMAMQVTSVLTMLLVLFFCSSVASITKQEESEREAAINKIETLAVRLASLQTETLQLLGEVQQARTLLPKISQQLFSHGHTETLRRRWEELEMSFWPTMSDFGVERAVLQQSDRTRVADAIHTVEQGATRQTTLRRCCER